MKYIALITITLLSSLFISCKGEEDYTDKEITKKIVSHTTQIHMNDSLNISILLDLSDRISTPHQKENDLLHLSNIATIFKNHVQNKKTILLEDHLQVFFEPNPSPGKTNTIATELKFDITKNTINTIEEIEKNYTEFPIQLYQYAIENSDTKKGADIWRFFKDKVVDYCIEKEHRNILIILTDGYLYHKGSNIKKGKRTTHINQSSLNTLALNKPSWKATVEKNNMGILWEEKDRLEDLEVLVLGIDKHEHKNPYAEDIIKYYWSQWFKEMGIKKYKIKSVDIPTSLKKVIQDFII